ncbi:acetyltransferase [Lysobacter soli]|uniref:DapH/DapD/GlmU-related protein n=1 Tax=Lysobacter soli TaxID=453783 RepID=UPI00209CC82C|nr:DapH/DapD/GlmU-related protein [Lysobacter soli]UTA53954.1 acetyltransferase [Lysobacter soli]
MWWSEIASQATSLSDLRPYIDANALVAPAAMLVGNVSIGAGTRICHGAYIEGPVEIGRDCLIGNNAMIRGATSIGDGVRIGFAAELKNAIVQDGVAIGPQCFVADSKVERGCYLGAQVRTSNHRLDGRTVCVRIGDTSLDTGMEKLGCLIGARSSLGVQVIVLPGRMVAPESLFAPRVIVERNLPGGRYRIRQALESF